MKLIQVQSRGIRAVGYEEDLQVLYIQFIEGDIYEYIGVPVGEFIDLLQAKSIGWFVNKRIKPFYDYRKLEAAS
ncbi:MAG TPA: KTSC domain-containing protein [Nitrospira sp.]|nr:KTSC domain-containing protein [Nitrospira sp.]